ncbi:MAG: hypothetical protein CBB71_22260 [Rhodopirellula sp. TMED11]|nr:MAG: hypothetical protein CBB71_22260 [Rhodopirellula sp. TMED11]
MPKLHLSRSIEIKSDLDTLYQVVADYNTWPTWSPWLLADPNAILEQFGDPGTPDSGYRWDSNVVGKGQMQHRQLQPPSSGNSEPSIDAKLVFISPWKSEGDVRFRFKRVAADSVEVSWQMDSSLPWFMFPFKGMMKSLVSMDYDRGLAMLKDLVETGSIPSSCQFVGETEHGPYQVVGLSGTCTLQEIGERMANTIERVKQHLPPSLAPSDQQWVALYHKFKLRKQIFDYSCGIILPPEQATPAGLQTYSIPHTKAYQITHHGNYAHLGNAWSAGMQQMRSNQLIANSKIAAMEIYRNNPEDTDPNEMLTDIMISMK